MSRYRFDEIAFNSTEKKKPVEGDRFTYIGLEHLDSGSLKVSRFGSSIAPIGEKLIMHKGDVLFGKRRAYQKKVAVAPFDGIFSAHGMVLLPKENVIDKNFFPLFISSDYFLDTAINISVGSLSPTINWSDLRKLEFELPDMDTQRKLAELLWSMVEAKEAYQELLRQTDELVKAQFIEMFGDPVENPMLWETVPFLQTGSCKNGMNFSSKESGIQIECLGVADFQQRMVIDDSVRLSTISLDKMPGSEYLLKDGDIVFVRSNGNKELVGRSAFVTVGDKKVTFSGFCIRYRKTLDELNHFYLLHLLRADSVRAKLRGRGANVQNLSQKTLASIDVPVPPLPLQEQFVAFAKQADKVKSELVQAVKSLDNTYKKILSENLG